MVLETYLQGVIAYTYRMPLWTLGLFAFLTARFFCAMHRRYLGKPWRRPLVCLALAVYLGVILWTTVLNRSGGGSYCASWIPLHTYWRVLCGENRELLRSAFMNVLLFFPAGLLLAGLMPEKWNFRRGMCCTILIFVLFSLSLELIQYFRQLGNTEIDDVLHNTLGAGLGYAAFHLDLDNKTR